MCKADKDESVPPGLGRGKVMMTFITILARDSASTIGKGASRQGRVCQRVRAAGSRGDRGAQSHAHTSFFLSLFSERERWLAFCHCQCLLPRRPTPAQTGPRPGLVILTPAGIFRQRSTQFAASHSTAPFRARFWPPTAPLFPGTSDGSFRRAKTPVYGSSDTWQQSYMAGGHVWQQSYMAVVVYGSSHMW